MAKVTGTGPAPKYCPELRMASHPFTKDTQNFRLEQHNKKYMQKRQRWKNNRNELIVPNYKYVNKM